MDWMSGPNLKCQPSRDAANLNAQSIFPKIRESRTRDHKFKIGERLNRNLKENIFTQRVRGIWNIGMGSN